MERTRPHAKHLHGFCDLPNVSDLGDAWTNTVTGNSLFMTHIEMYVLGGKINCSTLHTRKVYRAHIILIEEGCSMYLSNIAFTHAINLNTLFVVWRIGGHDVCGFVSVTVAPMKSG